MENTAIQHTFLKFDQSQKKQIFNKNSRTPDKTEKKTDLVKKTSNGNTGRNAFYRNLKRTFEDLLP